MASSSHRAGKVMRFIASEGMAEQDPDVVANLLTMAHRLAELVIADDSSSPEVRRTAEVFLEQLASDTFDRH